jgi:HlyD family secretion protein
MESSSAGIFRKAALERLSSPEQLDQLAGLTSPLGWLALAALGVVVVSALAWSVFGSVPTWVEGRGILVSQGGRLFDARAPADGSVVSIAAVGTVVRKGDLLAALDDTRLRQELQHSQDVEAEKRTDRERIAARYEREIALKRENVEARKANVARRIEAAQHSAEFYDKLLHQELAYQSQGYLTPQSVQDTRQKLEEAGQAQHDGRSQLLALDAELLDLGNQRDREVQLADEAISEAHRHVEEQGARLRDDTRVLSPLDGVITEVKTSAGAQIAAGKPLLSIEAAGEGLQLLAYIPPQYGKKLAPGMEVQIEPATVRKEEYGTLRGRVLSVSDFPMTAEGMFSVLENQQLVNSFMEHGPPYEARIALEPVPGAPGAYRWSSGQGPPVRLSSGTTAVAEIAVRRQAPIAFLLPATRAGGDAAQ